MEIISSNETEMVTWGIERKIKFVNEGSKVSQSHVSSTQNNAGMRSAINDQKLSLHTYYDTLETIPRSILLWVSDAISILKPGRNHR